MEKQQHHIRLSLNKKEIQKIISLLDGLPNEQIIYVESFQTGIAPAIKIKFTHNGKQIEHDVSDYESW